MAFFLRPFFFQGRECFYARGFFLFPALLRGGEKSLVPIYVAGGKAQREEHIHRLAVKEWFQWLFSVLVG